MSSQHVSNASESSVYRPRPNPPTPRALYVTYMDRSGGPFPAFRFDYDPQKDIQEAVEDAVRDIQNRGDPLPPGPDPVELREAGYLVFVMTPDQGRLTPGDGVSMWHKVNSKREKNHSFFNGADLNDVGGCSAMYCVNFRRNRSNNPLGQNDRELFDWEANHADPASKGAKMRDHDGSATNIGP